MHLLTHCNHFLSFCSLSVSLIRKKNSVDRPLVVFGDALLNLVSGDSIAVLIHGIGGRRDTDSLCNFRLCTAPSELYEAVCDFLIIQVFTSSLLLITVESQTVSFVPFLAQATAYFLQPARNMHLSAQCRLLCVPSSRTGKLPNRYP